MRLVPAGLLLFVLWFAVLPVSAGPACADTPLRINEFCAGPARDWNGDGTFSSRDDEWIEVVNTGVVAATLDGWLLTDADSLPRLALTGSLGPGERRLLFGRDSYDWERATGHPAFGFSLGNSGDAVLLWHVEGPDTVLVDAYAYRSHEAAADRAVGRWPDAGAEWALFDALNPYLGTTPPPGTGCAPTPGAANLCGLTPARPATWGRIKSLYR